MKHLATIKLMADHEGNDTGQLEVELHRDNSLQLKEIPLRSQGRSTNSGRLGLLNG
jgi:hypothetical protein